MPRKINKRGHSRAVVHIKCSPEGTDWLASVLKLGRSEVVAQFTPRYEKDTIVRSEGEPRRNPTLITLILLAA